MRKPALLVLPLLATTACTDLQIAGSTAIEQRRVMNDLQARATMAAVCDVSLGAYYRELNGYEREFAGIVCGADPRRPVLPEQLVVDETGSAVFVTPGS